MVDAPLAARLPSPRVKNKVNPKKAIPTSLLLLVTFALAGCQEEAVDSVVDLVVPVTVQPVALGTIEAFVSTTGSLRASRSADILIEAKGDLYYVDGPDGRKPVEGTYVEDGQRVARIESDEYLNSVRLESQELAVQNAERTLEEKQALFEEELAVESEVQAAIKALASKTRTFSSRR